MMVNTKYLNNVGKTSVLQIIFPDFFNALRKKMKSLSPEYELSNVEVRKFSVSADLRGLSAFCKGVEK